MFVDAAIFLVVAVPSIWLLGRAAAAVAEWAKGLKLALPAPVADRYSAYKAWADSEHTHRFFRRQKGPSK